MLIFFEVDKIEKEREERKKMKRFQESDMISGILKTSVLTINQQKV
jgi:hypothetical protein